MSAVVRSSVPGSVKVAAALLAVFGVGSVVLALVMPGTELISPALFARGILRALFVFFVAWSLLNRARWAWWVAVIGGVIYGGISLVGVWYIIQAARIWLAVHQGLRIFLPVGAVLLIATVVLLLLPPSQAAFRKPSKA